MGDSRTMADAFAAAPFEAKGWDSALRVLARATRSSNGQLLAMGERHLALNWCSDIDNDYYDDFTAIGAHRPEVNWRIAAIRPPFELTWEVHYDAAKRAGVDEAYHEHVRRFGAEHGAQLVLTDRPGSFFGIAVLRSASDGRTTEAVRRAMMVAAPHALAAIRTQIAIEHQGTELLRGSLAAMRVAAILLDARGKVCASTPAAEPILASGALRVSGGALHSARPPHDRALQRMVGAALCPRGSPPIPDLWIEVDERRMLVEARPLPRREWGFGFAPCAIVTLRAPAVIGGTDAARLAVVLGLTVAEGHVLGMLAAGTSRAAIAAARRTSAATVTSQLRSIYRKCDVRREAELVALAATIIGVR